MAAPVNYAMPATKAALFVTCTSGDLTGIDAKNTPVNLMVTGAMLIRRILSLARAPAVMAANTAMVILGAILLMVDIETSTAPPTVECLENALALCYQQVLAHYQAQDPAGKNKVEALQRGANNWTGKYEADFTDDWGVLGDIFKLYKAGELSDKDRTKVGLGATCHTDMRLTPSEVFVLQTLKGKMIRLSTTREVPFTGYNPGSGLILPDDEDIDSLSPGKWMTDGAFASLIMSMQFYATSAYDGPRPLLLPLAWANGLQPIFDSSAPTPVPIEAWQQLLAHFATKHKQQEVKAAGCIIVPIHHDNHYVFVVFFRQVHRVVFFDSGKQFNPSWPTQLMKDTFTEIGADLFFTDVHQQWVFEEGTITQQPDGIHCADYVLSAINALLQAADVRYWRDINLLHISMAYQRQIWLQPFLRVIVKASNAVGLGATTVEGTETSAPQDVVAEELTISGGSNPPAGTPHSGSAPAASSSASPPSGADGATGPVGPAKPTSGLMGSGGGCGDGQSSAQADAGRTAGHTSPTRTEPEVVEQASGYVS
ncbi:hypothetical protein V8C86DRAFT_3022453 [Haematococcus lacustris]